jgi:hypothetical protein
MMRDRVSRLGVRLLILWRLAQGGPRAAASWQELAAGSSVCGRAGKSGELVIHAAGARASSPGSRRVW